MPALQEQKAGAVQDVRYAGVAGAKSRRCTGGTVCRRCRSKKPAQILAIAANIENLLFAPQEMPLLADITKIPVLDLSWHTACIKPIQ
jgi:hypothetical protein